jgi:hypothetical protein
MTLLHMQCRVLLIVGLISAGPLTGCESGFNHFTKFYRPAETREGAPTVTAQPRATPPQIVYSRDPDGDGRILRQYGYVLIGTASFYGAPDLSYANSAVAQGQKVGATILLLKPPSYHVASCCWFDNSVVSVSGGNGFASYWAKSNAAKPAESR